MDLKRTFQEITEEHLTVLYLWKWICFLFLQGFSIKKNALWEPRRCFDSAEGAENIQDKAESVVCLFYYINPIDFLLIYFSL
jgi:hypothetical protein